MPNILPFLINQCNSLNYGVQKIIRISSGKVTTKIENILKKEGCYIEVLNENKLVMIRIPKTYSILDPDLAIKNIIKSKENIKYKLNYIDKIVKHYRIFSSTAKVLIEFLNSEEKDVNKKLKQKIERIKKEIKIKNIAVS
jgi:predicted metal-dependent RNase